MRLGWDDWVAEKEAVRLEGPASYIPSLRFHDGCSGLPTHLHPWVPLFRFDVSSVDYMISFSANHAPSVQDVPEDHRPCSPIFTHAFPFHATRILLPHRSKKAPNAILRGPTTQCNTISVGHFCSPQLPSLAALLNGTVKGPRCGFDSFLPYSRQY